MDITKEKEGFTLIELLVVIAIVGLLSSMAVYALNVARMKARDTVRLADMKQLRTALEIYFDNNSTFPSTSSYGEGASVSPCTGGWDCSNVDQDGQGDGAFMEFISTNEIIKNVPIDPLNDETHHYKYYYYSGSGVTYGCERPFYVLVATGFEASSIEEGDICYAPWKGNNSAYVIIGGQD